MEAIKFLLSVCFDLEKLGYKTTLDLTRFDKDDTRVTVAIHKPYTQGRFDFFDIYLLCDDSDASEVSDILQAIKQKFNIQLTGGY